MKVAVIGAGIAGLFAIKSCLEEGMEPQCFEKTDQLGGIWVYREQYQDGDPAGIYQGLRSNTSVFNHEASDYPSQIAEILPTWEHQLEYTQSFAENFKLRNYIKFNTEVISVEPDADGESWTVTWSQNGGEQRQDRYGGVLVCTGRFHKPIVPELAGRERFEGAFLTANQFKHNEQEDVKDKRVLIVGNSYTAADIAAIAAETAAQVYLSIGKGCSLVGVCPQRIPLDTISLNRGMVYTGDVMMKFREMMVQAYNSTFPEQEEYGICLSGADLMGRPILYTSHDLTSHVRQGKVKVKHILEEFTEQGAKFNDGTSVDVDTVIMTTGYDIKFPFLSEDIIADTVADLELYKLMWPLTTKKPNLAIIGCVKIIGSYTPYLELQTRWAAQVLTGKCSLPNERTMRKEVDTRTAAVVQFFGKSVAQTEMPVLIYQDFMAEQIGALPTWWHYLLTNPRLAHILRNGPAFPSTYRLVGPHRWDKAAERTIELYNRWKEVASTENTYGHLMFATAMAGLAAFLVVRHIRQLDS